MLLELDDDDEEDDDDGSEEIEAELLGTEGKIVFKMCF